MHAARVCLVNLLNDCGMFILYGIRMIMCSFLVAAIPSLYLGNTMESFLESNDGHALDFRKF